MVKPPGKVAYLEFKGVVLMPYRIVHPECSFFIGENEKMVPLQCLPLRQKPRVGRAWFKVEGRDCHVGQRCMERLKARLGVLFEKAAPKAQLIVLYFKREERLFAGVFRRDYQAPYVTTINQSAWNYLRERTITYTWDPPPSFWLL